MKRRYDAATDTVYLEYMEDEMRHLDEELFMGLGIEEEEATDPFYNKSLPQSNHDEGMCCLIILLVVTVLFVTFLFLPYLIH